MDKNNFDKFKLDNLDVSKIVDIPFTPSLMSKASMLYPYKQDDQKTKSENDNRTVTNNSKTDIDKMKRLYGF